MIPETLNPAATLFDDVIEGLSQSSKQIPSKYFYDERGSELFEQICRLEEYYPTRAELEIMENYIDEICMKTGRDTLLVELGSGSSTKTRLLLSHHPDLAGYVPVDISTEFLDKSVADLRREFPDLTIEPVAADYTRPFDIPLRHKAQRTVVYYPGSTLGNFTRPKARRFLESLRPLLGNNGSLLIGLDLKKDRSVLEAAYNDRNGITEAFNKNLLVRLNRELNADFDIDRFDHHAFFNDRENRVEMHLVSRDDQTVTIGDYTFEFKKGESVHTENSCKYCMPDILELTAGNYNIDMIWTDSRNYFSVIHLTVVQNV
jgi:dimethylhistidine N-methyltransferase